MRIMRDAIGSQKLIPCKLIILIYFRFNSVPDIACTCFSTNCLLDCKYFKRLDISASLPDPKGPLSDHALNYRAYIYSVDCRSNQIGFESSS